MMAVYSRDTQHWYFYQYREPVTALRWEQETGLFLGGTRQGSLVSLEIPGVNDDSGVIPFVLESKSRTPGNAILRMLFQFFRVDIDADGTEVIIEFLIDDVVRFRQCITGARTRKLYRFPDNVLGTIWSWRTLYTGSGQIAVYGIEVYGIPLEYA